MRVKSKGANFTVKGPTISRMAMFTQANGRTISFTAKESILSPINRFMRVCSRMVKKMVLGFIAMLTGQCMRASGRMI
jgi:hypothetical protein